MTSERTSNKGVIRQLSKFWRRCSLVTKYSVIISSLIVTCIALLGTFYFLQFRQLVSETDETSRTIVQSVLEEMEMGRGGGLAAATQRISVDPVLSADQAALRRGLDGLVARQDLAVLRIRDEFGLVLYEGGRVGADIAESVAAVELNPTQGLSVRLVDNMLVGTGPLMSDDRQIGDYAFIRVAKEVISGMQQTHIAFDHSQREDSARIMTAIILAGLLAILSGTFAAMRIARRLSHPIRQLADAADQLSRGEFGLQLPVTHYDEIGELFSSFNAMSDDLAKGMAAERQATAEKIARLEAEQASEAKTSFLANMSHEIRTPMNGVLGMAQLLEMGDLTQNQKQQVDVILRSGEALITVINDILDISKLQAGQVKILNEPFELRDTVEDVMALLGHTARGKGVELIGDMPVSIRSSLVGDEGRVRQVLINVVGNAIKFTERGSVKLVVREVAPILDVTNVRLVLDVIDTGIGIPADKLDRIFNQFEQADNTTTRQYGGTGLGLAISRQLTEAMGGTLSVTSELGRGSVFRVELECPNNPTQAAPVPIAELSQAIPLLVVDDDACSGRVACEKLTRFGARPIYAKDVDAAFSVMMRAQDEHRFRFPIVIVDHDMPGDNGLDLVRRVRANSSLSETQFVVVSSVSAETIIQDYAALGVSDVIEKPYPYTRLTEVIRPYLVDAHKGAIQTAA